MTHAYQEMYLSNAQALLGDAFDYAINACSISGNDFVKLFSVSGVSLRSIQMYEQHNKDINKASAETVLSLAKVLGCTMEDLLEK